MYLQLLKGSLFRRYPSTLLTIGAIWIGMTLVVALLTLVISVGDSLNLELSSLGANMRLEPVDASLLRSFSTVVGQTSPHSYLKEEEVVRLKTKIFWRNNLLSLSPKLWTEGKIKGQAIPVLGIWIHRAIPLEKGEIFYTGADQLYKHWKIQGRWPRPGKKECMIGKNLSVRFKINLGESLVVQRGDTQAKWAVVGVVTTQDKEDGALVAPLAQVQKFANLPGKVSLVDISALTTPEKKIAIKHREDPKSLTPEEYERWACTPYPGTIAVQIQNTIPRSVVHVIRRVSQTQGVLLERMEGLILALSFLSFLICCLSVMGVLALTVAERSAELALMQALGATRGDIFFLFLSESTLLGFLGALLATGTGTYLGHWLMGQVFSHVPSTVALGPLLLAPLIGVILANTATFWPLWQVFHRDSSQVLHEG